MRVEMEIAGLAVDFASNTPIVILKERHGERILPIWIGSLEASALAVEMERNKLPRPMTHDLMKGVIEALGGRLLEAAITDLRDNTYFAVISIARDGERIELDARPSDAIALVLRSRAPLYCAPEVLARTHLTERDLALAQRRGAAEAKSQGEAARDEPEGPRPLLFENGPVPQGLLESLSPEDFGKYKM